MPRAIAAPKEDSVADEGAAREQPNPVLPKTMSLSGLAPARVSPPEDRDTYSVTALADITDRSLHAAVARFNGGWPRRRRREARDVGCHLEINAQPGRLVKPLDRSASSARRRRYRNRPHRPRPRSPAHNFGHRRLSRGQEQLLPFHGAWLIGTASRALRAYSSS